MAQTRTLVGEESIRFRIFDFIAVICCQAFAFVETAFFAKNSSGLVTLWKTVCQIWLWILIVTAGLRIESTPRLWTRTWL